MNEDLQNFIREASTLENLKRQALFPTAFQLPPTLVDHKRQLFSGFEQMYRSLDDPLNRMTRVMASMTEAAERVRDQMMPLRGLLTPLEGAMRPLLEEGGLFAQIRAQQLTLEGIFANDMFQELRSSSRIAEQFLTQSDLMDKAAGFGLSNRSNFAAALDPLNRQYGGWLDVLTSKPTPTWNALGGAISIPSREIVTTYSDVGLLLGNELEVDEIDSPDLPEFEDLLLAVSPKLVRLFRGAIDRMDKRGIDYQRHAVSSMRELLDHTFLLIAPNEKIQAYLAGRKEPMKGEPGWGLRVEYVLASLDQPQFSRFMVERALMMKTNVKVLQGIVHDLDEIQTHAQLRHWINNCVSSLRNLLEARHLALAQM